MTDRDIRESKADVDGVRVFESGRDHRGKRTVILATVATALVVLGVTAALLLRHEPVTGATRESAAQPATFAAAPAKVPGLPAERVEGIRPVPIAKSAAEPRRSRKASRDRSPDGSSRRGVAAADPSSDPDAPPTADERQDSVLADLANEFLDQMRARGETGGLAAYPPPGTNPLRTGLVVPEDFELPEGYVRYYQVTDSGQRLMPILLFSPDYEFVDRDGKPIAMPKDGIVPPELAPPGLPLQPLVLPNEGKPQR